MRQQSLVTARVDFCQARIGFRGGQVGACLKQLLIHFRCADDRQQLPLADVRADVEVPLAEIAIGAGIERRIAVGIDVPGQNDFLPDLALLRRVRDHIGGSEGVGLVFQLGASAHSGHDPSDRQQDGQHQENHDHDRGDAARKGRRVGGAAVPLPNRLRPLVSFFLIHLYALSSVLFSNLPDQARPRALRRSCRACQASHGSR